MSSIVNLHTHSNHSDGYESPREIVQLAATSGVRLLALTDHDMTSGILEAVDEGKKLGVRVIPAAEISSRFHDKTIHILGYGLDIQHVGLQKLLAYLRDFRRQKMIEKMKEILAGLPFEKQFDIQEFVVAQGEYFCPPKSASFLLQRGIAPTFGAVWELIKGVKVAADDIHPQEVIKVVHDAGGRAVLAHPFGPIIGLPSISKVADEQYQMMKALKDQGLDGIECYQLSHHPDGVQGALDLAKRLGLLITAGSDWHGPLHTKDENIKVAIPNYQENFGDFTVPLEEAEVIMSKFT